MAAPHKAAWLNSFSVVPSRLFADLVLPSSRWKAYDNSTQLVVEFSSTRHDHVTEAKKPQEAPNRRCH
jgi:hypothetical protein